MTRTWNDLCTVRYRCPTCHTVTRYPPSLRRAPICAGVPSRGIARHAAVEQVPA